ncbi:MAG: DUF4349 domain-containing protein, partial [Clostridia bacterium]|nr:DUF4349 domain-containing protein [Clostridia bacterium]
MKKLFFVTVSILITACIALCGCSSVVSRDSGSSIGKGDEDITIESTSLSLTAKDIDDFVKYFNFAVEDVNGKKTSGSYNKYSDGGYYFSVTVRLKCDQKETFINKVLAINGVKLDSERNSFYTVANKIEELSLKQSALERELEQLKTLLSGDYQDKVSVIKEIENIENELNSVKSSLKTRSDALGYTTVNVSASKTVDDGDGTVLGITVFLIFA